MRIYKFQNLFCLKIEAGEEVTGLAISEEYIAAQFFLEPEIHVFSRLVYRWYLQSMRLQS